MQHKIVPDGGQTSKVHTWHRVLLFYTVFISWKKCGYFILHTMRCVLVSSLCTRSCIICLPETIVTNRFGKAVGPIINTGPGRSHLCLGPDTLASHVRASVSEQIPVHTVCTGVVSQDSQCELHRGQSQTWFPPSFITCLISDHQHHPWRYSLRL